MVTRVLVPMDDSAMAEKALRFALQLHPDAEITVQTVVGEPSLFMGGAVTLALADDLEAAAEELATAVFDRAEAIAEEHDVEIETVVDLGKPSRAIVRRASDFDVVVIGSHGRDPTARILMGNVAERVTRRSPVPVTVVR